MTREEAINNLNMISVAFVEPVTKEQRKLIDDTFDMAIKALEQEPSGDLISRQDAIDAIWDGTNMDIYTREVKETLEELPPVNPQPCDDAIRAEIEQKCDRINSLASVLPYTAHREIQELLCEIMDLPSVKQEPKTGHWIHFATSDDCSECGWSTGKYISPSKFCPNCGCRMVEPQESEDAE